MRSLKSEPPRDCVSPAELDRVERHILGLDTGVGIPTASIDRRSASDNVVLGIVADLRDARRTIAELAAERDAARQLVIESETNHAETMEERDSLRRAVHKKWKDRLAERGRAEAAEAENARLRHAVQEAFDAHCLGGMVSVSRQKVEGWRMLIGAPPDCPRCGRPMVLTLGLEWKCPHCAASSPPEPAND